MNPGKVISVVEIYEERLSKESIPKIRMDLERTFASLTREEILAHAHFLCDGVKKYVNEGPDKWGKANRHLSVIQVCLSLAGWYTLGELMDHNRPDIKKPEKTPHYFGWHYVVEGFELYRFVLKVLKQQQGRPVPIDEFLGDEGVLSCYTPNHFMRLCNPPNIKRARQCIKDAIGYLRRKGHIIDSTREFGQIAYSWYGK